MKQNALKNKLVIYALLVAIVIFNFYLYRAEFTVKSDPNDNIFHYALIDEAHSIWKNIFAGKMSPFYLFDSWNFRWGEGLALSTYYNHLPQAAIALLNFVLPIDSYQLYVVIRTLMFILLPLSFYWAVRILDLPDYFGVMVAFFSQVIITDGLYGIDVSSFIYRGWGLSAQLMAVFFLPQAFAYTIRYLKDKKDLFKAILFNFIVAQCHFGLLLLLLIGYPFYFLFELAHWKEVGKRLLIFLSLIFLTLSYFILPFFTLGLYRNYSYWDNIWKFNSWGINQVIIFLTNGDLFDFNRLPILTFFLFGGIMVAVASGKKVLRYITLLFFLYLILYFGRTTFGSLIDLVPGFSEYHLHRIILMVQFIGLMLAGWFVYSTFVYLNKINKNIIYAIIIISVGVIFYLEQPIIKYARDNTLMIQRANLIYKNDIADYNKITSVLKTLPKARVYAGRPGNWGRNFKIADTQMYMALSRDGFPTMSFLPESWSPNSDSDQFFDDQDQKFYELYQVGYIVMPKSLVPPKFAVKITEAGNISLYSVKTRGYMTIARSSMTVTTKKTDLLNLVHLWFGSNLFKNNNFPKINYDFNKEVSGPQITLTDLNHYINDGKTFSIWNTNAFYIKTDSSEIGKKVYESSIIDGYTGRFIISKDCSDCIILLRESFSPGWNITLNGRKVEGFPVFPFFIGIPVSSSGEYNIRAVYGPSAVKKILLVLEIVTLPMIAYFCNKKK